MGEGVSGSGVCGVYECGGGVCGYGGGVHVSPPPAPLS